MKEMIGKICYMKEESNIIHIVKDGETLPDICQKIYGDSNYYIQIAKYNNLKKFRNLKDGDQLIFPPITSLDTSTD